MKLITEIPLEKQSPTIDYRSKLLLLGSCFAGHMADKMDYYKFQSYLNPFGILFHPAALENLVQRSMMNRLYSKEELVNFNDVWHCMDAHSDLSHQSASTAIQRLNQGLEIMHKGIVEATHIIITLGTAWVYRYKKSSKIVANCHKIPQDQFYKELLSVQDIFARLKKTIAHIQTVNPKASLIFTVSPVRHLRDGFTENMRSKAHLISAVQDIVVRENCHYFPAYELMIDEMRDYRFYGRDLVHPNELAIEYIWEKFSNSWIDAGCKETMGKVDRIRKGLKHRPFHPESQRYKDFQRDIASTIRELQQDYPFMEF